MPGLVHAGRGALTGARDAGTWCTQGEVRSPVHALPGRVHAGQVRSPMYVLPERGQLVWGDFALLPFADGGAAGGQALFQSGHEAAELGFAQA